MNHRFSAAFSNNGRDKAMEQGAIIKKGKGLIKAALVYPNTYKAGMSSLGFQCVYRIANQYENVACERIFLPEKPHTGPIKSLETGLELNQFDIVLFSISFENDFVNLVPLLLYAGIPLRSPDRNHIHPLVVAGGVACFLNPEPIAPFIDCFLLGEAECLFDNFFDAFSAAGSKESFLASAERKIPGAYVPGLHPQGCPPFRISVQYLKNLDDTATHSTVLTSKTAFKDTFLIETLKGCPHGCRFCSAGFIYRPPRIYPKQNIIDAIDKAEPLTDKIGLVSSAVADHPQITSICAYALQKNLNISFSSLRADKLNTELINTLKASKVKTATIAPEAGSARMRNIINKKITENDVLKAVQKLVTAGIPNLRLYFMIGLPFEIDDDIQALIDLILKVKNVFLEASRPQKRIGNITLSINPFIPKPSTPFQWAPMAPEKELKRKVKTIRQHLNKVANVKINFESLRKAKVHALLSMGDRKMADLIELAAQSGWSAAVREHKSYCSRLIYNKKDTNTPLPWDFLDNRIKKGFLTNEYQKASMGKKSPACPMIDCTRCRVCIDG